MLLSVLWAVGLPIRYPRSCHIFSFQFFAIEVVVDAQPQNMAREDRVCKTLLRSR
jgi:hypothetical protein